jgi:hypothetical protein
MTTASRPGSLTFRPARLDCARIPDEPARPTNGDEACNIASGVGADPGRVHPSRHALDYASMAPPALHRWFAPDLTGKSDLDVGLPRFTQLKDRGDEACPCINDLGGPYWAESEPRPGSSRPNCDRYARPDPAAITTNVRRFESPAGYIL